jgi:two-component system sensor histidine kinase DctS
VRRRERAEAALGDALAIRRAMEDSLPTGLRARDLDGRVTYVNPAFCKMVGFAADELLGLTTPPYWPPEDIAVYAARQPPRVGSRPTAEGEGSGLPGFETRFMRRDGERFAVMVYEAPLVDGQGRQTGWMSAVLDISEQRRAEDLSRLQQERMQATARLATVGEMASLLSHELNQPLSAIASYAAGSLNLIDAPDPGLTPMLREALEKIAAQAERAGQVIRSVNDFVRRRAQDHERVAVDTLVQAVLPLVRMQARKSGARIETELPAEPLAVRCDRTMVEQVLLNLARNGLQAMEQGTEPAQRVLRIEARVIDARWVGFAVVDAGGGIAPEVATRLFTPFFTTRPEGMGLGLSLCRTVVELHGGAIDVESPRRDRPAGAAWLGSRFRFTLPAFAVP